MTYFYDLILVAEANTYFALASVILSTLAFLPYIRDTLARRTRPERASWLIWSVLSMIAIATQLGEAPSGALLFVGTQAGFTCFIFVLSIWLGSGNYLSFRNIVLFGLAGVGLVLWSVLEEPAYALVIAIALNALGGLATILKAYRAPSTETFGAWVLCAIAAACGVASVGVWDPMQLAYPSYLFALYCGIVLAILLGRSRAMSGAVPEWSREAPASPRYAMAQNGGFFQHRVM